MFESWPKNLFERKKKESSDLSVDNLRNPEVSLDRNESGDYSKYLLEASQNLEKIVSDGFWTKEQAQAYAKGYAECRNALEVANRNALVENIIEDRPMEGLWGYEEKSERIYRELDEILEFSGIVNPNARDMEKEKEEIDRANSVLERMLEGSQDVEAKIRHETTDLYRLRLSRTIEGEDYSFYINIETGGKNVSVLSYIPPSEILYAFRDLKNISLIKDLLENHPRLDIALPPQTEKKIEERRKGEKAYREKVEKLSGTLEISETKEFFEAGTNVPQGGDLVASAESGPLATGGVGPCVVVCGRGKDGENKLYLGMAHMEAGQNENKVLKNIEEKLISAGVPKEQVELFLVGGWETTEELQKRLLALSEKYPIKGIKINIKDEGLEYPETKNYLDVVMTKDGRILYGENGKVFKAGEK